MIHATINGIPVEVEEGTTILQAAEKCGVDIPTLCYLKHLAPEGACRLCVVEIKGRSKLVTACSTHIAEGNEILTESESVVEARRAVLDLLMSQHNTHCFSCAANGDCKLQTYCMRYGLDESTYPKGPFTEKVDDSNEFLQFDPTLCIRCRCCVNTCEKLTGRNAICNSERGYHAHIGAPFGLDWNQSICESCGCCVQACPTGALTMKRAKSYRKWETKRVLTTCPHCATGCQYYLLVKDGKIVGVEGADGPSNHGLLCVKGRSGSFDFVHSKRRITEPMIRNRETNEWRTATWDEALDLVASKFMEIKEKYGPDALAGFACSRSTNEDVYMLQKMVRTAFGTNNTDNCARV